MLLHNVCIGVYLLPYVISQAEAKRSASLAAAAAASEVSVSRRQRVQPPATHQRAGPAHRATTPVLLRREEVFRERPVLPAAQGQGEGECRGRWIELSPGTGGQQEREGGSREGQEWHCEEET